MRENHTIVCMDYKDIEPYLKQYYDVLNDLLKELFVVKSELEGIKMMIKDLGYNSGKQCSERNTKRKGMAKNERGNDRSSHIPSPNGGILYE